MTLYQFIALKENEQAEILWSKGVFSGDRQDDEHNILLYQLHGFYVEVFFHRNQNEIKQLRPFSSTEQLLPYLVQIEIGTLMK